MVKISSLHFHGFAQCISYTEVQFTTSIIWLVSNPQLSAPLPCSKEFRNIDHHLNPQYVPFDQIEQKKDFYDASDEPGLWYCIMCWLHRVWNSWLNKTSTHVHVLISLHKNRVFISIYQLVKLKLMT